jgi:hypothetical protein
MSKFNIPYLFNSLVLVLDEEGGTHVFESLKDIAKGLQPLKKITIIICSFIWINYHWVAKPSIFDATSGFLKFYYFFGVRLVCSIRAYNSK